MKKFVAHFVLVITLCLAGCNGVENNAPPTTPHEIPVQTSAQDISNSNAAPQYTKSFDEYSCKIPKLKDLYPDFICYDIIESLGGFIGFGHITRNNSIPTYHYQLLDKNGLRYGLYVFHGNPTDLDMGKLEDGDDPSDLRFHKDSSGYYYIGDIEYAYYEGKLYNIKWKCDQRTIVLQAGSDYIHTSPLDGDTFMSRLLNAETAEAAVAEFNAKVAQARAEKAG